MANSQFKNRLGLCTYFGIWNLKTSIPQVGAGLIRESKTIVQCMQTIQKCVKDFR